MISHVQKFYVYVLTASSVVHYSNLKDFHFQVEYSANFHKLEQMQFMTESYFTFCLPRSLFLFYGLVLSYRLFYGSFDATSVDWLPG